MHSVSTWYLYYLLNRKLLDSVDSLVYSSCIRAMGMIGYSFFSFPHNVNFNCWLHKMSQAAFPFFFILQVCLTWLLFFFLYLKCKLGLPSEPTSTYSFLCGCFQVVNQILLDIGLFKTISCIYFSQLYIPKHLSILYTISNVLASNCSTYNLTILISRVCSPFYSLCSFLDALSLFSLISFTRDFSILSIFSKYQIIRLLLVALFLVLLYQRGETKRALALPSAGSFPKYSEHQPQQQPGARSQEPGIQCWSLNVDGRKSNYLSHHHCLQKSVLGGSWSQEPTKLLISSLLFRKLHAKGGKTPLWKYLAQNSVCNDRLRKQFSGSLNIFKMIENSVHLR